MFTVPTQTFAYRTFFHCSHLSTPASLALLTVSFIWILYVLCHVAQTPTSILWYVHSRKCRCIKDKSAEEQDDNNIRGYLVCFKIKRKFTSR
jgi:hypothetical protein